MSRVSSRPSVFPAVGLLLIGVLVGVLCVSFHLPLIATLAIIGVILIGGGVLLTKMGYIR